MLLKYNISNIKPERRILPVTKHNVYSEDNSVVQVVLETSSPHGLSVGDKVYIANEETGVNEIFKVINTNFTTTTFTIEITRFKPVRIKEIRDGEAVSINEVYGVIPVPMEKGTSFNLKRIIWSYVPVTVENESEITFLSVKNVPVEYIGYNYIQHEYTGVFYHWQMQYDENPIECTYISDTLFQTELGTSSLTDDYVIEDDRIVSPEGSLKSGTTVYEYMSSINIQLPISSSDGLELNDEETARCLLKEKRDSLIPDIVDYEKRCFTPYNKNSNKFTPADKITFNIFLRDRSSSDNWTSNDLMGWNQMPLVETTFLKNKNVTNGDLLGHLGFTDDDIYYRKKKVSKSFLRLSFYDTNVPMNQMLLFYSTIFLDANELYGKYIKHIAKKVTNPGIFLVKDDSLGADNLTLTFNVSDKFNRHASSEGFYLYLFPDGITNGVERTIYMKVEFNHAGYGTTLPLILPNNGATLFDFSTEAFPTSLMNIDNGNLKEFYRQLYIPVKIKYDESVKDFIYYFPMCKNSGDTIVFNLFEPKINPVTGSSMSSDDSNISYKLDIIPSTLTLNARAAEAKQLAAQLSERIDGKPGTLPVDVTNKVLWSSSDNSVATVSMSGLVTGKKKGNAVITAKYQGLSGSCDVTVALAIIPPEGGGEIPETERTTTFTLIAYLPRQGYYNMPELIVGVVGKPKAQISCTFKRGYNTISNEIGHPNWYYYAPDEMLVGADRVEYVATVPYNSTFEYGFNVVSALGNYGQYKRNITDSYSQNVTQSDLLGTSTLSVKSSPIVEEVHFRLGI